MNRFNVGLVGLIELLYDRFPLFTLKRLRNKLSIDLCRIGEGSVVRENPILYISIRNPYNDLRIDTLLGQVLKKLFSNLGHCLLSPLAIKNHN